MLPQLAAGTAIARGQHGLDRATRDARAGLGEGQVDGVGLCGAEHPHTGRVVDAQSQSHNVARRADRLLGPQARRRPRRGIEQVLALAREAPGVEPARLVQQAARFVSRRRHERQRRQQEQRIDPAQRAAEGTARCQPSVAHCFHDPGRLQSEGGVVGGQDGEAPATLLGQAAGEKGDTVARNGGCGIFRGHGPERALRRCLSCRQRGGEHGGEPHDGTAGEPLRRFSHRPIIRLPSNRRDPPPPVRLRAGAICFSGMRAGRTSV